MKRKDGACAAVLFVISVRVVAFWTGVVTGRVQGRKGHEEINLGRKEETLLSSFCGMACTERGLSVKAWDALTDAPLACEW
ncbi:MAG: hypothetical protein ACI35P_09325 [Bacillus sp. (in: firmicutes)]